MGLKIKMRRRKIDPKVTTQIVCDLMWPKYIQIYFKNNFIRQIYKENVAPQMDPETAPHVLCEFTQPKCTWQWISCGNLQVKGRRPRPRHKFYASLRNRTTYGHVTTSYMRKFANNIPPPRQAPHISCEPAQLCGAIGLISSSSCRLILMSIRRLAAILLYMK